jgi:hypothetical protein
MGDKSPRKNSKTKKQKAAKQTGQVAKQAPASVVVPKVV